MSQTDAPARPAKAAMPVNLLAFRPVRKPGSSIRGFAHVQIGALKISDVMILQKDGRAWANMPSKPRMTREGHPATDKNGRQLYAPIVEWANKDSAERFSDSLIAEIQRSHPDELDPDGNTQ